MEESNNLLIKLARRGDANRLNEFYNNYYNENRTTKQWFWLFGQFPLSDGRLPFAFAELKGKVVGTQALIPIKFINEQGTFWTGKSEETLVDPSMRRLNIFRKMYDRLFQIEEVQQLEILWCFSPALKAFEKIGYSSISCVCTRSV